MNQPVLILPGIFNSGPQHWQSLWEAEQPHFRRVMQRDWDYPVCEEWVDALEAAVKQAGEETVLVAHSLGCLTVAHWAASTRASIAGALLVAVPDPDGPNFPAEAVNFGGLPQQPFGFPSIVVASTNDPYGGLTFAQVCAKVWSSQLVNLGDRGHINADSGLGRWPEGLQLLDGLIHA
jgi:uncharacterized protein